MLVQYMFAFIYPDTRLATSIYEEGDAPDGVNTLQYAEDIWKKLKSEQPRLQDIPYDDVHVYIRSADKLYVQVR
jgi:hypothetical protein